MELSKVREKVEGWLVGAGAIVRQRRVRSQDQALEKVRGAERVATANIFILLTISRRLMGENPFIQDEQKGLNYGKNTNNRT